MLESTFLTVGDDEEEKTATTTLCIDSCSQLDYYNDCDLPRLSA